MSPASAIGPRGSGERTLIVAALEAEVAALRRRLRRSDRRDCRLCVTGMGAERVVRGTAAAIAAAQRAGVALDAVLHIGFAGALDPALRAGDVARPCVLMTADGDRPLSVEGGDRDVRLLSTTATVGGLEAKRALFEATSASAVDMESYALAGYCIAVGLRYAAIRAISDPADALLPPAASRWVDARGRSRPLAALAWAGPRPGRWAVLARLGRDGGTAARALSDACLEAITPTA